MPQSAASAPSPLPLSLSAWLSASLRNLQQPRSFRILKTAQRWPEIVQRLAPLPARTADEDYIYASALAHLDRLPEAARAFAAGRHLAPHDPRFPIELAGIAFKQKRYPQAASLLRNALKLAPGDAYANDFLATIYFLEGNTAAALKYWNRIGKPRIEQVRLDPHAARRSRIIGPSLRLRARIHTHARATSRLANAPPCPRHLRATAARPARPARRPASTPAAALIWSSAAASATASVTRASKRSFSFCTSLPFQAVTLDYFNARREAINFTSLYRWDENKRRVLADFSAPFEHRARYRTEFTLDLRNENWALRNSFTGPAPVLASLNLRRESGTFSLASFTSDPPPLEPRHRSLAPRHAQHRRQLRAHS